jgi:hypothetical protein
MFVMCEVLFERLKSVTIFLLGLIPMPCISVTLMAQYLNIRQRKLGTIIIQTISYSMIVRTQVHCPRAIVWSTQVTSNKPSPAVVPLHLLYQSKRLYK